MNDGFMSFFLFLQGELHSARLQTDWGEGNKQKVNENGEEN